MRANTTLLSPFLNIDQIRITLRSDEDYNYVNVDNPKARVEFITMKSKMDLIDCWREEHKDERKFSFLKENPIKEARTEFFFISSVLLTDVNMVTIPTIL